MDEKVKRLDDRIDHLQRHIASNKRSINALANLISLIDERVANLDKIQGLEGRIQRFRGEDRFTRCTHLVKGYCEEEGHGVSDPNAISVRTVKKNDKYYPQVTWVDCEMCSDYFLGKKGIKEG